MTNKTINIFRQKQHDTEVLKLRLQGLSYEQIGIDVACRERRDKPYSKQAIHKTVNKMMQDIQKNFWLEIELERTLEAERLELLMQKPFKKAVEEGSLQAVDRVLKIMDRKAKLLGLDSPSKTSFTNPEGNAETQSRVVLYVPDNGRGPSSN